jgi:hypothetical protein
MFMRCAVDPESLTVRSGGSSVDGVSGAILIWGAMTAEGRDVVMRCTGLADVLSVEAMIVDLRVWKPAEWTAQLSALRQWTSELFDELEGRSKMRVRTVHRIPAA